MAEHSTNTAGSESTWRLGGDSPIFRLEWQWLALAVIAAALFGIRLTDLPIRGEETRRAEVASEMLRSGDWVVPRQQMAPFLSRPPLGSYPIAGLMWLSGTNDLWTVRLPSFLASWLATLVVYFYCRRFLPPLGALAAGLCYPTMGLVLQLGRLAESEALFALLLSGALLVWHAGYRAKWPGASAWIAGYALAALAALVKGPQAPVYFVATVGLYLLVSRQWRELFSWRHLVGLGTFAVVLGAWQIPFTLRMGWPATREIWTGDVGMRFEDTRWQTILLHALIYPIGVLIATLPWSPLLSAYGFRSFRRSLGPAADSAKFVAIAVAVSAATCWPTPGAKERYMMPVFPCLAVLMGIVLDRAWAPAAATIVRRGWTLFAVVFGAGAIATGLAIAGATLIDGLQVAALAEPSWFVAVFLVATALCGAAMIYSGLSRRQTAGYAMALAAATFCGLFYIGVVIDGMTTLSEDTAPAVAELKHKLPPGTKLVSFGLVETLFTYYYGDPVTLGRWPVTADEVDHSSEYFCFTWDRPYMPDFPFVWRVEQEIPCDRQRKATAVKRVIIGRRLESAVAASGMRKADPSVRPAAVLLPAPPRLQTATRLNAIVTPPIIIQEESESKLLGIPETAPATQHPGRVYDPAVQAASLETADGGDSTDKHLVR